ncbi:MAG: hypothetical protein HYW06_01200 [Gemmatimonadetes bacterium]|nr:hypothetical protein [Gemmatimonadota bacterium]MBI2535598.1 hypothetical protein [Gemmatimonadota bacterium]
MSSKERKWARVKRSGAHGLRRGAWYVVLNENKSNIVVLDVSKKAIPIDRSMLDFTTQKPRKWSVVQLDPQRDAAELAGEAGLGPLYGVCPNCAGRANLKPDDTQLTCPVCQLLFEIDWSVTC